MRQSHPLRGARFPGERRPELHDRVRIFLASSFTALRHGDGASADIAVAGNYGGSCANEQTALRASALIHSALWSPGLLGQSEGVQMYLGGGLGLVLLIVVLILILR
jgi:hypothetical protein